MSLQEPIAVDVCTSLEDMRTCMMLQRAIWNDADEDVIPASLFVVANKIGGQVLLARAAAEPVGFSLAFPGFHGRVRYLHSHIAGVVREYQNRGVGRLIKTKQRELALAREIHLIEWTFDPLEVRNAFFNIVRLGAIVRRFHANLYGVTSSPLHRGLPTDRFVAEWQLDAARVADALEGREPVAGKEAREIVVPAELGEWKRGGSARAAEFQVDLREQFQSLFAQGFVVTAVTREERGGIYKLEPGASVDDGSR
jgi:predicted GNAT superfamily acetyltransferase